MIEATCEECGATTKECLCDAVKNDSMTITVRFRIRSALKRLKAVEGKMLPEEIYSSKLREDLDQLRERLQDRLRVRSAAPKFRRAEPCYYCALRRDCLCNFRRAEPDNASELLNSIRSARERYEANRGDMDAAIELDLLVNGLRKAQREALARNLGGDVW